MWELYYLLYIIFKSPVTTTAITINLSKFKIWEYKFHLSMGGMSKPHYKKKMYNGRYFYGQLKIQSVTLSFFFDGDLPKFQVSLFVSYSYSLSSLCRAVLGQW